MKYRIRKHLPNKTALPCLILILALAEGNSSVALAQFVEEFGYVGNFKTLKGQVRDGLDEPVSRARLTVKELKTGKTYSIETSDNGYFENSRIPSGKYRIEVSASGFNLTIYTVRISRSSSTALRKFTVARLSPGCATGNSGVAIVSKINRPSFKH